MVTMSVSLLSVTGRQLKKQTLCSLRIVKKYMSQVQVALCAACTNEDFEDSELTPEFDYYADDVKDGFEGTHDETLPPTP